MPFLQYAVWNAYACCSLWPFWSRLSIWIYQLLTEVCPEIIMIWWKKEQVLPFYQSNLIFAYTYIKDSLYNIIKLLIELFWADNCHKIFIYILKCLISNHVSVPRVCHVFSEYVYSSCLIGWIDDRNMDRHMVSRQCAFLDVCSCWYSIPFWSRLNSWIYPFLLED